MSGTEQFVSSENLRHFHDITVQQWKTENELVSRTGPFFLLIPFLSLIQILNSSVMFYVTIFISWQITEYT